MLGPELQDVSERRERGLGVTPVPREQSEAEVGLPEVRLGGEGGLERGSRLGEAGRVALDRTPPRGLERLLETGVADPEAETARLSSDLSARLGLEQRVELAPRALPVSGLEHRTREIQPHDRWTVRGECGFVVRDGPGVLAARVQGRAIRGVQLPSRSAGRHRALERDASRFEVASLQRDDRRELLRRTVGLARRRDATQVSERGGARTGIRVELGETHEVRVGQRVHRVRVLESDDRLVDMPGLRAKLAEDVVRAPRARPDQGEVLERADLPTDVAALQRSRSSAGAASGSAVRAAR